MKDETEIETQTDKAAEAATKPSKYPGMTYEQGVRDALDWVLDNIDEAPMED
jgi:hypothetical protein